MKKDKSMNTILFYDAYLEFLDRVSCLLSHFRLRSCCWNHGSVCFYHFGSGSRFWISVEQLPYINEVTDEWMENYLPGEVYRVSVEEDGRVFDQ